MDEGAALEAEVDMLMTSEVLQHKKVRVGGGGRGVARMFGKKVQDAL